MLKKTVPGAVQIHYGAVDEKLHNGTDCGIGILLMLIRREGENTGHTNRLHY